MFKTMFKTIPHKSALARSNESHRDRRNARKRYFKHDIQTHTPRRRTRATNPRIRLSNEHEPDWISLHQSNRQRYRKKQYFVQLQFAHCRVQSRVVSPRQRGKSTRTKRSYAFCKSVLQRHVLFVDLGRQSARAGRDKTRQRRNIYTIDSSIARQTIQVQLVVSTRTMALSSPRLYIDDQRHTNGPTHYPRLPRLETTQRVLLLQGVRRR